MVWVYRECLALLEPLIRRLAEELELDEVPVREKDSAYQVLLNTDLKIRIQELDPGLAFWARIAPCPKEKREDIFILLMKANFLGQGTGNNTIALDENENFLTLSSVLPYDMNYKTFKDALEDFANYRDYWKEEIIRYNKAAQENIF